MNKRLIAVVRPTTPKPQTQPTHTIDELRSDEMYLLHEALARARMRSAPRRVPRTRPAREVMVAARRHQR